MNSFFSKKFYKYFCNASQNSMEGITINVDNVFDLGKEGGGIGDIKIVDNVMAVSYLDGYA